MYYLTLVRHAKSSWNHVPALTDFDRPLNHRGLNDASVMGRRLLEASMRPDIILSSPAVRARETATLLAEGMQYPDELRFESSIYDAGLGQLQKVIESLPEQAGHVMLVGHNPGMESLSSFLDVSRDYRVTTCNVMHFRLPTPTWQVLDIDCAELVFHWTPKDPQ